MSNNNLLMNQAVPEKELFKYLLLPVIAYFCCVYLTFNSVEEDAFIYFRIADNIANGYGNVFNIGGERIESGSGFIWQMMLAVLALLPVNIIIATKCLGVVFALLSLRALLKLSNRFIDDKYWIVFPALFLAISTPFFHWSHRGLETPFFVFVLLWLLDWLTDKEKIKLWMLPALVVFLSRPEGFLMVGAIMPWLWLQRKNVSQSWKRFGLFVLLCFLFLVGRFYYFHDLLPHAFYHKMGSNNHSGFIDLLKYSAWNGLPFFLLLALPGMFIKKSWQQLLIPLMLLLVVTGVWGVIGADWKSFNRQLSSWLPFVYLFLFIMFDKGIAKKSINNALQKTCGRGVRGFFGLLVCIWGLYKFSRRGSPESKFWWLNASAGVADSTF